MKLIIYKNWLNKLCSFQFLYTVLAIGTTYEQAWPQQKVCCAKEDKGDRTKRFTSDEVLHLIKARETRIQQVLNYRIAPNFHGKNFRDFLNSVPK